MTTPEEGKERFKKFLKVFEDVGKSSKESAKLAADLLESIGNDEIGLTAAIADLTEEVHGMTGEMRELRKDLRTAAKAGGLHALFSALRQ